MLQSKAGIVNKDYLAQKNLLKKLETGALTLADYRARPAELFAAELAAIN